MLIIAGSQPRALGQFDPSLHAYLKFDEASGTTAADSTGNGWNGTLVNGPIFVGGFSNNAVSLNGNNQYVSLPPGVVGTLTDFTIATWVNLNSVSTWARIFDFGDNAGVYMFLTPLSSLGGVRFAITTNSNTAGAEQQINGSRALPSGQWHHVAVTLSGGTGTLYVDGSPVGTNSAMTLNPSILGSTTQNWIGRSQYSADPYLNGLVDDFRIYNGALSATDVRALATVVAPTITTQPQSLAVTAGSNATFTAVVTGTAPLAYQWQFNRVNLTDSGHISGSQSTVLKIIGAQFSDEGAYSLVVTNAAGPATSAAASLTVLSAVAPFVPIPLTGGSYNQDMVVEKTARAPLVPGGLTTASMDGGTTNTGFTWYERGFNLGAPATGLPPAGSTITNRNLPDHLYRFAPSYVHSNNVMMIDAGNNSSGNFKLPSPGNYAALSFLASMSYGNAVPFLIGYTISHSNGTQETGTIPCFDWWSFNAGPLPGNVTIACVANGAADAQTYAYELVNLTNPVLYSIDVALTITNSSVTNILLKFNSGLNKNIAHAGIFAVSGATTPGGAFTPITVTGYNQDVVMEASAAGPLTSATSASMDTGISNTSTTWYEKGYYPPSPSTGLPAAGSILTNLSAPDRTYILAPSYTANNAVLLDAGSQTATLAPATLNRYSALSILHATGFGSPAPTIQCVATHLDGTTETNNFTSADWFGNVPYAFVASGRINLDNRQAFDVGTTSPRLYFSDFFLTNTNSALVSLTLNRLSGAANSHTAIFAVSGIPSPQGTPVLSWTNPAPIIYGSLLSSDQLNASADVPGSFAYSPPAGTALNAGTNLLTVVFSPTNAIDYKQATGMVSLVVFPAPLVVTANSATRNFGQQNPVFSGTITGVQNQDSITPIYSCGATPTSPPGAYPIVPGLLDPGNRLGNYRVTLNNGILRVTPGQVLAHDDAGNYVFYSSPTAYTTVWSNGMNEGFGFGPWTLTGSGPGTQTNFIDDGGNIATTNNSAWGLHAFGPPPNLAVAFRGFSNALPIGTSFKLKWRTGDIGYSNYNFAGFSLRSGNATGSTTDYLTGERFSFYYQGGSTNISPQDDARLRDGSGDSYAPAPGVGFSNIHSGVNLEFTLLSSNTYRLVVLDAISNDVVAVFDSRPLAGSGPIESVALYDSQTDGSGGEYSGNQLFNWMELSPPASPLPPIVTVTPTNLVVAVGSPAAFYANAIGTPPLSYQWLFNGAAIVGSTDSTFNIPSAVVGNGGTYQVIVTNVYGAVTSAVATLSLLTPPAIIKPPANAQVIAGTPASFTVLASSSGPLTYQWLFGGLPIPGATNFTFTIRSAQLTNAGNYSVQVANLAASITTPDAALLVLPAPPPAVPLSSYTLNVLTGMNLIANQLDSGGNTLLEVLPVAPDGAMVAKFDNASATWSESTYNAALQTWVPSSITLSPGDGAFLQSPTNFSLTFTGTPHVPVLPVDIPSGSAWLLSRQTNDVGTYENIIGTNPAIGATVYKWDPASASYVTYTYSEGGWSGGLEPTAAIGEAVWIAPSGGGPEAIPALPLITQQPVSVAVALGDTASFTVAATGTEPLYYQWRLNGNNIPGATSNVLTLSNIQVGNGGNYDVVVDNLIGIANSGVVSLSISNLPALPFGDNFADAGSLGSAPTGAGTGSNVGATMEPGEPSPDFLPGGASVWLSWQPQLSGVATFSTVGSGFDTLLAVYTGTSLSNLVAIAADNDSAGFLCSLLGFNAEAGMTYFIQVDGFHGAQGGIALSWNLNVTSAQLPVILTPPQSQTVLTGSNATLAVTVQPGPPVTYQWLFNNEPIPGATDPVLTLSNFGPTQVGLYAVGVTNPETLAGIVSPAASVQLIVADSGQQGSPNNVQAQDKFGTVTDLTPPDPNIPHDPPPASSYTGSQTFSTLGATADPGEPAHCGYPACGSYWISYQAPASGLLTINTLGTTFNAILEVYTGSGSSLSTLSSVACSANHGVTAGETVTFAATSGTIYWVVIEGVNCATGSATINFFLSASPAFTLLPVSQTAASGSQVALLANAVGAPALGYQWQFNGSNIPNATNNSLVLPSLQAANEGSYTVMATNLFGTNVSPAATVLSSSPRFLNPVLTNGVFSCQFVGSGNVTYVFQTSTNLATWLPLSTNQSPIGIINLIDPAHAGDSRRYYRAMGQ